MCDTLRDLVSFEQFRNVKNTHGGELLLVRPATLLKETLLLGCFSRFSNCTNRNKSSKVSHMWKPVTFLIDTFEILHRLKRHCNMNKVSPLNCVKTHTIVRMTKNEKNYIYFVI